MLYEVITWEQTVESTTLSPVGDGADEEWALCHAASGEGACAAVGTPTLQSGASVDVLLRFFPVQSGPRATALDLAHRTGDATVAQAYTFEGHGWAGDSYNFV